ncbi:MAG: hypothetical protein WB870_14105 [Gallionellaceae bacterium]
MAKLIHSMVSTLPWRHFVQIICMTVAAIAAAVAAKMPNSLKAAKNSRTGKRSNNSFMAADYGFDMAPFYQKNRSQQDKMQDAAQRVTRKQSFSECLLRRQQVIPGPE